MDCDFPDLFEAEILRCLFPKERVAQLPSMFVSGTPLPASAKTMLDRPKFNGQRTSLRMPPVFLKQCRIPIFLVTITRGYLDRGHGLFRLLRTCS